MINEEYEWARFVTVQMRQRWRSSRGEVEMLHSIHMRLTTVRSISFPERVRTRLQSAPTRNGMKL
jgi:hypothetical protein